MNIKKPLAAMCAIAAVGIGLYVYTELTIAVLLLVVAKHLNDD